MPFVNSQTDIELAIFDFLSETFRLESDHRQRTMGLAYITEPTIELVYQITQFAQTKGFIVCETSEFLGQMHSNLASHYVERNDDGIIILTAEVGDLARVAARLVARQLA